MAARVTFLVLVLALCPLVAQAVDVTGKQPVTTKELCSELVPYTPSDDVTYKPGKDVYWRDVAPADLDQSGTIQPPEEPTIAISLFQARQLNLPVAGTNFTPEMYVGDVTVKKDGSVFFNGKRISQPQVQFLCDDRYKVAPPNTSDAAKPELNKPGQK